MLAHFLPTEPRVSRRSTRRITKLRASRLRSTIGESETSADCAANSGDKSPFKETTIKSGEKSVSPLKESTIK